MPSNVPDRPLQLDETTRINAFRDPNNGAIAYGEYHAGTVLSTLAGKGYEVLGPPAFKQHRDNVIADSAKSPDRVIALLLEQILWAHQRAGDLLMASATQKDPAATGIFTTAAARLMAECRRTALAVRELGTPPARPQLTLVQQENVAAGDQQIAFVEPASAKEAAKKTANSGLVSKSEQLRHAEPSIPFSPTNRRKTQPIETENADASRAPAFAGSCNDKPALDTLNGAKDDRG